MAERTEALVFVGSRLRKWRDSRGFSLATAAGEIKAAAASWRSWEMGEKAPDLHFAFAIEELTRGTPDPILASEWAFPRKNSKAADQTGPQQVVTAAAAEDLARAAGS